MLKADRLLVAGILTALTLLLASFLCAPPATANILPEAAMLIHVRPALPEGEGCTTTITSCSQMVHTSSAVGEVEFLIFFYPRAYQNDHLPIHDLATSLTWPDTWSFVRWSACGGAEGSLQPNGPNHALNLTWPECPPITGTIFLVASLVLNVTGPGQLDFSSGNIPVWLGCPPDGFAAYAWGIYAAAGMECGYAHTTCAYPEYCSPTFDPEDLALTAPVGGLAEGQAPFEARSPTGPSGPCPLTVTSHAPWAQATVVPDLWPDYHLVVTADAMGLDEGVHETWIEVSSYASARCVKVDFTVTPAVAGLGEQDPDQVRSQSWGKIKDLYRRP